MRDFICINPNVFEKKYPSTRAGGKPGISSLRLYKFETLSGAGTVAEMSEAKTPEPGEYWISDDGSIIRIVGVKLNGSVIYENQAGFSFQFNSMTNWRHEPRCTSFDWVEPPAETWPKYYVGKNCSDADAYAYVRFDNATDQGVWVSAYGSTETHDETYAHVPDAIRRHSWRETTEAEALARVKPFADAMASATTAARTRRIDTEGRDVTEEHGLHDESDRIVKRVPVPDSSPGRVAWYRWSHESQIRFRVIDNRYTGVENGKEIINGICNDNWWGQVRSGALIETYDPAYDHEKKITVSEQPSVKRVPVRLWRRHYTGVVEATIDPVNDPDPIDLSEEADQILHDENGFYVEGAE